MNANHGTASTLYQSMTSGDIFMPEERKGILSNRKLHFYFYTETKKCFWKTLSKIRANSTSRAVPTFHVVSI